MSSNDGWKPRVECSVLGEHAEEVPSIEHRRRLKMLMLEPSVLPSLFAGKSRITNMPDGWEITRVGYMAQYDCFFLTVMHSTFDTVRNGDLIPQFVAEVEPVDSTLKRMTV